MASKTDIINLALSHLGSELISDITTDQTKVAPTALLWFDTARDEMLRSHAWNFAIKRKKLTLSYNSLTGSAITDVGGEYNIEYTAHGLETGDRIFIKDVEGITLSGNYYITKVDADNFTLDDTVFASGYTSSTGKFVQVPTFDYSFQFDAPSDMLRLISLETIQEEFSYENNKILAYSDEILVKYVYQCTDTTLWPKDFVNAFSFLLASYLAKNISSDNEFNFRDIYEKLIGPLTKVRDSREGRGKLKNSTGYSSLVTSRGGYSL